MTCEAFQAKLLSSLPMNHGGHSIVLRGLYALQLQPWLESFPNQIKVLSIDRIKGSKAQIQQTLNEVFEFLSLPPSDIEDVQAKNSRSYSEMSIQVHILLDRLTASLSSLTLL
jgi:RecA-family ATPase